MLDDCSRLRDVMSLLPEDRHFIPSILLIVWDGGAVAPEEILNMVRQCLDVEACSC